MIISELHVFQVSEAGNKLSVEGAKALTVKIAIKAGGIEKTIRFNTQNLVP